ncbi:MAG: Maf family protein [Coriobacteriia bacterium]
MGYHRGMRPSNRIVLASASPRRRRLLAWLDLPFQVHQVDTPESLDSPLADDPGALAVSLALEKSAAVRAAGSDDDAIVLTFDTIVAHRGEVLGKPSDVDDAWRMLRHLSGQTHQVFTGCAISLPGGDAPESFWVGTDVQMHELSNERIEEWMASGEFMGCAGAYNIEGQVAAVTCEECFQNVTGTPLCHLYRMLNRPEIAAHLPALPVSPVRQCDLALGRVCKLGPRLLGTD